MRRARVPRAVVVTGKSTIRYRVVNQSGQVTFSTFTAVSMVKPGDVNGGR